MGLLVLVGAWVFLQPQAFLPHARIVIGLPYEANDAPSGMIPMGETLYHPKPQVPHGHPGIDFGWQNGTSHAMIAAHDALVTRIEEGASEPGKWDVELRSGVYLLRYKEMEDVAPGLRVGSALRQGDLVGHAGHYCDQSGPAGAEHCWFNVHWELASVSLLRDRFCPQTYFDPASRAAIDALWASVPASDKVKAQFPEMCSGDYAGKAEG